MSAIVSWFAMQDLLQNPKLEILPANPFLLRMAGFQALIDGWFSAPADNKDNIA
jgi:hypothetical protein